MEGFKPLFSLGNTTVVERCIDLFRRVGIHSIHVVIGHQADEMRMALRHCNVELIVNPNYDEGMFSSVIAGIRNVTCRLSRKPFSFCRSTFR
jgi:CTP:molybdopterin cytidylyltransferase MocA